MYRLKSLVVLVALSAVILLPVMARQPQVVLPLSRAVAFDRLAEQLERGKLSPATKAEMTKVLVHLHSLLPAGDARRTLRYRYTWCLLGMDDQPAQGLAYAQQGIEEARRIDYPAAEANFHYCRGEHQEALTTPRDALPDYNAGIEVARRAENLRLTADGLSWRGNVQSLLGESALALVDFLQAQRDYEQAGESFEAQQNLLNIAVAYRRMGEYDKARSYMQQSLADAEQHKDVLQQIAAEAQLGFLESEASNQAEALRHFERSLALAGAVGDHESLGAAHLGKAEAFNLSGRYPQALVELAQAQANFDQAADHSNQGMIALQTAEAEAGQGRHTQALLEFAKAERLLAQGGNLRYMMELLDSRARSYEALGEPAKAVADLRHSIHARDALDQNTHRFNTTLMSYQFDTARRDQEDRHLKEESALQARQLAALERASEWQHLAMLLGGLLLLGLVWQAVRQVRHSRRLHVLAMTDALTGIANRRRIERVMIDAMRDARQSRQPMTVVVFDIDHFKRINDLHGHQVGDAVLVRLVVACNDVLREFDQLGRVGGEEFLVILPRTLLEDARVIAERLRNCVETLGLGDIAEGLGVTISLGVAQLADPEDSMEALIDRADQALYRAKAAGRNRVEIAEAGKTA